MLRNKSYGVVGVCEGNDLVTSAGGIRKETVAEHDGFRILGKVEAEKPLIWLGVVSRKPKDGKRIVYKHL